MREARPDSTVGESLDISFISEITHGETHTLTQTERERERERERQRIAAKCNEFRTV